MTNTPSAFLPDTALLQAISASYRSRWACELACCDETGRVIWGDSRTMAPQVLRLVNEALRWGEPTILPSSDDRLAWALPLMHNAAVIGSLVCTCAETAVFPIDGGHAALDLRAACSELRELAERHNLTNAALLAQRRCSYRDEQEKAYLLHGAKSAGLAASCHEVQELYLREEPLLLSAIRRGEHEQARHLLNRVLLVIYSQGEQNLQLIKALLLELVVAMSRAAIEAGGRAEELLGVRFAGLTTLAAIDDHEALATWVTATLTRIMECIARQEGDDAAATLEIIRRHMREHLADPLRREELARAAGISPARLSRLVRSCTGHSWTEELARIRCDHACSQLRNRHRNLAAIALDCGFPDQSYFTKVFHKTVGLTPAAYRAAH